MRSAAAAMNISGESIVSIPRRVVLADPRFREPQAVEHLDQLEVALEAQRGVLVERVERCEEDAVPEFHESA